MKKLLPCLFILTLALTGITAASADEQSGKSPRLLYQGHGSLRIVTADDKVIYIDPYAGEGYDLPADLILVSHGHPDHIEALLLQQPGRHRRIHAAGHSHYYCRHNCQLPPFRPPHLIAAAVPFIFCITLV